MLPRAGAGTTVASGGGLMPRRFQEPHAEGRGHLDGSRHPEASDDIVPLAASAGGLRALVMEGKAE